MIGKKEEYEKMFQLEEQLWWYRILHENVLNVIRQHYGTQSDIRILDAGCGTGGLLHFLRQNGYSNLRGLDGSTDGVAFCLERGLPVEQLDLNNLADYYPQETNASFDVIVCNDVFCYFDNPALVKLLKQLAYRLKPGGILITNNNAFNAFKGSHDLAVGSTRRFVRRDFDKLLPATELKIKWSTYWSLLLSPLILFIRQWQSLRLRFGNTSGELPSDVYMPGRWVNKVLYAVVHAERQLLPRTPFGSSLFMVLSRQ